MPEPLHVGWDDYHRKIEQLARIIRDSKIEPEQIMCIAKGGLRVGDILARIFKLPLAILSIESYSTGENEDTPGEVIIADSHTSTHDPLGGRLLLVDDLVDRGGTLKNSLSWLHHRHGSALDHVWTGVIWYKERSGFEPDFFVEKIPGDDPPWIMQPFERYDRMRAEDLG